jgi:hypothetical protein
LTGFAVDPRNLTVEEIEAVALSAVPAGAAPPEPEPDVMSAAEGEGRPPRQLELRSIREPRDVQRERKEYYRWLDVQQSTEFGSVFTDRETGEVHSYAHWAPVAMEANQQLELELPGYSKNHVIRQRLAQKISDEVVPVARERRWGIRYNTRCAEQLQQARWSGAVGYSLSKGKNVVFWDTKAGLSRLCPDDAREEAQRLSKKVLGPLEELQASDHALHYAVFTTPNTGPGGLRKEMASICRRFRNSILKAKDADGSLIFPEIKGALCVLEAPLGSARDWNVHLNVILVVKGYLDYGKLRRIWHWDVEIQKLATGPGVVKGALTELIKYAVAATVAKSAEKAAAEAGDGSAEGADPEARRPPPPMLEWTGAELFEWLMAMRGFRRTRTYGCLYRLKRPDPDDLGQIVWLGRIDNQGGGRGYRLSSALLDSIPEDKSSGQSVIQRYISMIRGLALPGIRGAGTLGDSIPRDALHRIEETSEIL